MGGGPERHGRRAARPRRDPALRVHDAILRGAIERHGRYVFNAGGDGFCATLLPQLRVVDGQFEVRDVLDLTVTIDHNVVDGAPAERFGADLRELIENPTVTALQ